MDTPPNSRPFDPRMQRHSSLLLNTPASVPATGSDLVQMTQFLTAVAGLVRPEVSAVPSTPPRSASCSGTGALVPSPSDLSRFLTYTAEHPEFALPDAQQYEACLKQEGFAPDVILALSREDLTNSPVKLSKGNAIRLKRACEAWLDAPDGKRLRKAPSVVPSSSKDTQPMVRYERRWIDSDGTITGRNSWFAPPMHRDESWTGMSTPPDPATDGKVFYLDAARGNEWVEVPPDFIVPAHEEAF